MDGNSIPIPSGRSMSSYDRFLHMMWELTYYGKTQMPDGSLYAIKNGRIVRQESDE